MASFRNEGEMNKPHSYEALIHSKNYSRLLDAYITATEDNMRMKMWLKAFFFLITVSSMLIIAIVFYKSINYVFRIVGSFHDLNNISIEAVLSLVTIILPSVSSLLVAFIKIPKIIAKYLFNADEDYYMSLILKNIQDYDRAVFAMEQEIEELLLKNKDQEIAAADDEIEDSPIEQAQ